MTTAVMTIIAVLVGYGLRGKTSQPELPFYDLEDGIEMVSELTGYEVVDYTETSYGSIHVELREE